MMAPNGEKFSLPRAQFSGRVAGFGKADSDTVGHRWISTETFRIAFTVGCHNYHEARGVDLYYASFGPVQAIVAKLCLVLYTPYQLNRRPDG